MARVLRNSSQVFRENIIQESIINNFPRFKSHSTLPFYTVCFIFLSKEIEATVERLKKHEVHLTVKEKALKQRELELVEREKKLEQQFNVVVSLPNIPSYYK